MFLPGLVAGAGFGLSFAPMTIGGTAGIPPQQAGLASGLVNTTRQVGGAIGLAVAAAVHAQSTAPYAVAAGALAALLLPGRLGMAQHPAGLHNQTSG